MNPHPRSRPVTPRTVTEPKLHNETVETAAGEVSESPPAPSARPHETPDRNDDRHYAHHWGINE